MLVMRKPTHPGEVLREDILKPLSLTVTEAAKQLGVTIKTLSALLNCKASLSPDMAVRIKSWFYMQAKLDLWTAQKRLNKVKAFKKAIAA